MLRTWAAYIGIQTPPLTNCETLVQLLLDSVFVRVLPEKQNRLETLCKGIGLHCYAGRQV